MSITLLDYIYSGIATFFGEMFGCMFGGGSFFIQPALLAIGIPAKQAVANDVAAAIFSCAGFLLTSKYKPPNIAKITALTVPTAIIGAFTGGYILSQIAEHIVEFFIIGICTLGLIHTFTHLKLKNALVVVEKEPSLYWKPALMGAGLLIGLYNGISGAGSGTITIILLSLIMRKNMKTTIYMAICVTLVSILAASASFAFHGLLNFKLLAFMIPGAFLGGIFAAKISTALPESVLRFLYSLILGALIIYLLAA